MKQPMTRQGQYLQDQAQHGHFKQKLAETALALTEAYCKADGGNRQRLGSLLAVHVYKVLTDCYGWPEQDALSAQEQLVQAFHQAHV